MSWNGRHISITASNRLESCFTSATRPGRRSESAPGYDVVIISVTEQACAQFATAAAESIANKGGKLEPKGRAMTPWRWNFGASKERRGEILGVIYLYGPRAEGKYTYLRRG